MRKSRFGIGAGFMMALAGVMGSAQAMQPLAQAAQSTQKEMKSTAAKYVARSERKVHSAGGLDLVQRGEYGMSPKEYGLRYGNGASKKHKSNRLRLGHSAKIGRR